MELEVERLWAKKLQVWGAKNGFLPAKVLDFTCEK
jgi:hypothetical protein